MKNWMFIFCLAAMGCSRSDKTTQKRDSITVTDSSTTISVQQKQVSKKSGNAYKPYSMDGGYLVIDTGEYSNGPMGGLYAIVKKGNHQDTIDRGLGIVKVNNDSYLFQKLKHIQGDTEDETTSSGKHLLSLDYGDYVLATPTKTTAISKLVSGFDNVFSSPNAINGKLYFWELEKQPSSALFKIWAVEYDPVTGKTQSHFLFDDGVETDDAGYFANPYLKKDTIYFHHSDDAEWKFSPSFKPYQ